MSGEDYGDLRLMSDQSNLPFALKRTVREGLSSLAGSATLAQEIAELRAVVQARAAEGESSTQHLQRVEQQVQALAREVSSLAAAMRTDEPVTPREAEGLQLLQSTMSVLEATVLRLGERVHLHQVDIEGFQAQMDRLAGSVQDGMALDRRLRRIENRLFGADSDA